MNVRTLKRIAFGALAAVIGFALAQQDVLLPDQVKVGLVAALGWLGAQET
jgi:hypothetical protein